MKGKVAIVCNNINLDNNNKEFIFNIQKAMLVTLFENKRINHFQYEYAVELLEADYRLH